MRQVIIARKDLKMSPGKLAAQCCHASMAFLTTPMKDGNIHAATVTDDIYQNWICGSFVKTVCEAKNRTQLLKAVEIAKDMGLEEGQDFFLIKDNCLTELTPEEIDENGIGRTLTCIGFVPLPDDKAFAISKHFQLYK